MTRLPQIAPAKPQDPDWYQDGVRFRCLGSECGLCCSGRIGPGAVWLNQAEMEQLAEHLSLTLPELKRRYVRRLEGRYSLKERANYDCIFYREGAGCSVYAARPGQCRTYPFWDRIMATPVTWAIEAESCPGIEVDDTRVEAGEVRRQLAIDNDWRD